MLLLPTLDYACNPVPQSITFIAKKYALLLLYCLAAIRSTEHLDATSLSRSAGDFRFRRALLKGGAEAAGGKVIFGLEVQGHAGPRDQIDEDVAKHNLWLKYLFEYAWTDSRFDEPQGGSRAIPGALEHVISGGVSM